MALFRNVNSWRKTHRIEMFSVCVGAVLFGLAGVSGSVLMHAKTVDAGVLTTQAIYASNFTTSLSGVKGNIEQVYRNVDGTKCAVFVRLDDSSAVSSDAKDYQVFMKGYNVSAGRYADVTMSNPTGGYCVYGQTGYAVIYLSSSSGFGNQAVELIVRSNNTVYEASANSDMQALQKADGTYATYDQYRIIVNPSAEEAIVVDFLDEFDPAALYKRGVADGAEEDIRAQLEQDVHQLNTTLGMVLNYQKNLTDMGVRVPQVPVEMAGDAFENETLADGSTMLVYKPSWVSKKGVNIDWFHQKLSDGPFLTESLIGYKSAGAFFADLNAAQDTERGVSDLQRYEWSMQDGTVIDRQSSSELADVNAVNQNIDRYIDAVSSYVSLKKEYQCNDLVKYLYLEYNMNNIGSSVSGNFAEGVITAW